MTRMTIKQIIQDLVKSYINGYGVPADQYGLARGYWLLRDNTEIARDIKAQITFQDYEMWVMTAIADYETNLILTKFK